MKLAVKSALAGAAIVVATAFGAPMAHADVDTVDAAKSGSGGGTHSGTYGAQSKLRDVTKHEPSTKTSRQWGPSQATSKDWGPSQFGR